MTTNSPLTRPTRTAPVSLSERNLRQVQGGAGADHAQDVGIVLAVGGQARSHDLDFVDVAGREERPDGAVDEAGGQDFLGGGPAFALDEAAGKLAGGVDLLAVIDDEREEILGRVGPAFDGRDHDNGVAIADDSGPVGLLGELAGFDGQSIPAELQFDVTCLHGSILSQMWQERRRKLSVIGNQ